MPPVQPKPLKRLYEIHDDLEQPHYKALVLHNDALCRHRSVSTFGQDSTVPVAAIIMYDVSLAVPWYTS